MKRAIILFAVCLVLSATCYFTVYAEGYDSTTDPVITLSYVNNNLIPQINNQISELQKLIENGGSSGGENASSAEITALGNRISDIESKLNLSASASELKALADRVTALEKNGISQVPVADGAVYASQYTAIFIEYGKKLMAPTAAVELILRSGTAVVVSPFADQGISDITGGGDLLNNVNITHNHALIIPRGGDGRGILITSPEGAYVMVRGEYKIVD